MQHTLTYLKMRVEGCRLALRLRRGVRRASAFHQLCIAIGVYDHARTAPERPIYSHEMNMRVEHGFAAYEAQS